jgi:hypothetical protein
LFDFQAKFSTDRDCIEYLSEIKWSNDFECKKCKHTHYCKGVSRFYAKVIDKANAENLGAFMRSIIKKEAKITTDECTGYKPLEEEFENMNHIKSGEKGENFPELHRVIMNFKKLAQRFTPSGWRELQEYLNEYNYRFNRSFMKGNIFDNLLHRMMKTPPCTYKTIIN